MTNAKSCVAQGNDMVLKDGSKSLTVRAVAPASVAWKVTDLTKPPSTWDVANKGSSMISFEAEAPEGGALDLRVQLVPGSAQAERAVPDFLRDMR